MLTIMDTRTYLNCRKVFLLKNISVVESKLKRIIDLAENIINSLSITEQYIGGHTKNILLLFNSVYEYFSKSLNQIYYINNRIVAQLLHISPFSHFTSPPFLTTCPQFPVLYSTKNLKFR